MAFVVRCRFAAHVHAAIAEDHFLHFSVSEHPDLLGAWLCDTCIADLAELEGDVELERFLGRVTAACAQCAEEWRATFAAR